MSRSGNTNRVVEVGIRAEQQEWVNAERSMSGNKNRSGNKSRKEQEWDLAKEQISGNMS